MNGSTRLRQSQGLIGPLSDGTLSAWQDHWNIDPVSNSGRRDQRLYDYAQTAARASLIPEDDRAVPLGHGSWREIHRTVEEVAWEEWTSGWDYVAGSLIWLRDRNLFTYAWDAALAHNTVLP